MDFKEHLKKYLSDQEIDLLIKSFDEENKHAALLNLRKMDDETFIKLFPHVTPHPIVRHAYLYNKNEYDLGKNIYHTLGCFYLQEPSAMIPAFLLNPNKDDLLLDMCAAPGGKSVQSSFLMSNQGLIISNDLSKPRAMAILENVERLGIGNIIITNNDLSLIEKDLVGKFDKIILDAPCSGSGMFRKDENVKNDWSYNKVLKFAEIQKELIMLAYSFLKEGGSLVYSTCSYSYEEDEEVIDYLLKNSDAELVDIKGENLYVSHNLPYGVHTFPYLFDGEGHYICLIRKPGTSKPSKFENNGLNKKFKDLYIDSSLHNFDEFGDYLFATSESIRLPKNMNIIRKGVKVLEWNKGSFKYDYHYSHYLSSFDNIVQLNEQELFDYMRGYQLNKMCARGYTLLKFNNISVGFGKNDGNVIKNHYPKALRNKF